MNNESIVNSIKNLCKENDITVGQLEKTVGLSQGLVSKWKDKTPSLDKIIDIADYFHVSLDEVVGRSQNENNFQNDDIIVTLMSMTTNKEIEWNLIDDYENLKIHDETYEEIFNLYDDEVEVFKCKYEVSFIFLVVQYSLEQGVVEDLNIQLYLQPDEDSKPVIQDINDEWVQAFWVKIREPYMGVSDELKADVVRQKIIKRNNENMFNGIQQYFDNITENDVQVNELLADENARKVLTEVNSPEIQQLITMFTNPKMTQAMESAQKLIRYFGDIKNAKENKDK